MSEGEGKGKFVPVHTEEPVHKETFLALATDGYVRSASYPEALPPGRETKYPIDSSAVLDPVERKKIFGPFGKQTLVPQSSSLWLTHTQ